MADVAVILDPRSKAKFDASMAEYLRVSRRNLPEVLNKQGKNFVLRAAKFTPVARPGDIHRDVQDLKSDGDHIWFKMVARAVVKKHGQGLSRKAFKKAAKEMSRQIIRKRKATAYYMRSAWLKSADKLRRTKKDAGPEVQPPRPKAAGKFLRATKGEVTSATVQRPAFMSGNLWYGGAGKSKIAAAAGSRAFRFLARDMKVYILRKQKKAKDAALKKAA